MPASQPRAGQRSRGPWSPRIATGQWVHLAVVLDTAKQTLSTYADGVRVGHATGVALTLEQVLNQEDASANRLYIGKSEYDSDPDLNAKVHDVRLYSIALTDQQVATIRNNALSGLAERAAPGRACPPVGVPPWQPWAAASAQQGVRPCPMRRG